jgi:hypothetical protein
MKQLLIIGVVAALLTAGNIFAQEPTRTIVTIGGSYWNATYTYQDEDGKDLFKFGTGNLVGPYLSISNGKWNFGSSMYFGSFPVEKFNDLTVKRSDLNFNIGYRVHPNINIIGGVKYLSWTLEGTSTDGYYTYNYSAKESGPMFGAGIAGTIPLGSSGLYAFGSAAYLAGTMKNESTDSYGDPEKTDIPATLVALNLGLGYRFVSGFGLNVGYRADLYTEKQDVEILTVKHTYEYNLSVKGLVATVSYTFK